MGQMLTKGKTKDIEGGRHKQDCDSTGPVTCMEENSEESKAGKYDKSKTANTGESHVPTKWKYMRSESVHGSSHESDGGYDATTSVDDIIKDTVEELRAACHSKKSEVIQDAGFHAVGIADDDDAGLDADVAKDEVSKNDPGCVCDKHKGTGDSHGSDFHDVEIVDMTGNSVVCDSAVNGRKSNNHPQTTFGDVGTVCTVRASMTSSGDICAVEAIEDTSSDDKCEGQENTINNEHEFVSINSVTAAKVDGREILSIGISHDDAEMLCGDHFFDAIEVVDETDQFHDTQKDPDTDQQKYERPNTKAVNVSFACGGCDDEGDGEGDRRDSADESGINSDQTNSDNLDSIEESTIHGRGHTDTECHDASSDQVCSGSNTSPRILTPTSSPRSGWACGSHIQFTHLWTLLGFKCCRCGKLRLLTCGCHSAEKQNDSSSGPQWSGSDCAHSCGNAVRNQPSGPGRLSQYELSRMGSIQSDSSGFGDADPPSETAHVDSDALKVASLGSSSESCGTLASSTVTAILREPRRGEMATQTSVDSSKGKSSREPAGRMGDEKEQFKQSPRPTGDDARYVTMCYIPSLSSRFDQSDGLRYRGGGVLRGSKPITDLYYPQRPRGDSDPALDFGPMGYIPRDEVDFPRPRVNSDADHSYRSYGLQGYDPRWRGYEGMGSYSSWMHTHIHPDSHGDWQRNYTQYRPHDQSRAERSDPRVDSPRDSPHTTRRSTSQRTYTSHIDLYASETGVHRRDASYRTSPRRHSDEGILEGRNDAPLSVELANAMRLGVKGAVPVPTVLTSNSTTTSATSNVISSTSVYIHSTAPATNTVTTPARYKTEAGFHFPPIAGNLSGFRADFHSTPSSLNRSQQPTSRQRSCDILEDDFGDGDPIAAPGPRAEVAHVHTNPIYSPPSSSNYPTFPKRTFPPGGSSPWHDTSPIAHMGPDYSQPPRTHSRASDDLEGYSSMAESSSDFSMQSMPEGHIKSGILDSRKLGRLINQPIYYKGQKRCGSHYRPRRLFKEWTLLSKRKRLQEENRLLQYAIQKYKTELSILETSFMVDYQAAHGDLTDEEREEVEELEWLWGEVKGQVMEMERLLVARVKSVHAGNDFHSLMSSMGVIQRMIDLIKEQLYQQQVSSNRGEDQQEEDYDDDMDFYNDDFGYHERRSGSFTSSQSWMAGAGHMSTPRTIRRFQSSSTSHIPADLNVSLEQIKASLLSQVQTEIKESTKKLEMDLQEKDKEIKQLKEQLVGRSTDSLNKSPKRWTPKTSRPRPSGQGQQPVTRSNSRSRLVGDKVVTETDV